MKILFDGDLISIQAFNKEMKTSSVGEAAKAIKMLIINNEHTERFGDIKIDPLNDFRLRYSLEELLLGDIFKCSEVLLARELKRELLKYSTQ